jgi:hypothetical protein
VARKTRHHPGDDSAPRVTVQRFRDRATLLPNAILASVSLSSAAAAASSTFWRDLSTRVSASRSIVRFAVALSFLPIVSPLIAARTVLLA